MNITKRKIDLSIIEGKTFFVKKRMEKTIQLAEQFKADPSKKIRHEQQECPVCFYIDSRIGGAMMTSVQCALCDNVMQFSNTCTDILCLDCAKRSGLCRHCGSDVDGKNRRKRDITPVER